MVHADDVQFNKKVVNFKTPAAVFLLRISQGCKWLVVIMKVFFPTHLVSKILDHAHMHIHSVVN